MFITFTEDTKHPKTFADKSKYIFVWFNMQVKYLGLS